MQDYGQCISISALDSSDPLKYYIIAGESSGDLYGGLLMAELKQIDAQASFRFWGGPKMSAQSSGQLKSIKETSFMGFWEVIQNLPLIKKFFDFAKYSIKEYAPDVIILIDYPGFNLRMATWAKKEGYQVAYYVSPQLWAWKERRHTILRENTDNFFVILPFEEEFYKNLDTPCTYVGHPLLEIVPSSERHNTLPQQVETIGLFPGSRKQEIKKHLAIMIAFALAHPDYQFVIAGVSHIPRKFYLDLIKSYASHIDIEYDNSYGVMSRIDFAISSSGTATLELALHLVPQIVVYKTSQLSFMIGKRLVKTDYISLVNLIAQKEVVPELLQEAFNELHLKESFIKYSNSAARKKTITEYESIRAQLGDGTTSQRVAQQIYTSCLKLSS